MKILVGSALDAMNLALENILKELMVRGHQIEVLAYNIDSGNTWMFENLKIPLFLVKDLTQKKIKQFDIAFCCEDMVPLLLHSNIYIFSYNSITDTWNGAGSDFMFTMARDRKIRWREDCAIMPIGNTKNDAPMICEAPKKQILFIDAGHNPFGEKGKRQVANMLLAVCRAFPDYTIVIKPRWLPNEHTTQTHRAGLHIYAVLEELTDGEFPSNLVLLNEHRNLQELIDESVSVITTSINCWIDAACRGKGCIVVDGFDAEEQFETRPSFRDSYEVAKRAGCCARYDEVVKYLPSGLKWDEEYLQRRIPYKSGASSRIVDVIEYVYYNFLVRGTFPAIREYDFETYKTDIIADPKLSLKELKYNRFKNGVCSHFLYDQFDFIRDPIDDSQYFQLAKDIYRLYPLNEKGFHQLRDKMISERRRIIIDNTEICMRDDISQSILLMELYGDGQYDKILTMSQEHIQCVGPYYYYLGLIYRDRGQIFTAIYYFCIFLKEATARSFNKYPQESNWGISTAYNYVFHFYDGENISPDEYLGLYASLYEQRDIEIVTYNNRKRAHNWLPNVAKQLANDDPVRALKCLQLYAEWEYHYNIRERDEQLNAIRSSKLYRLKNRIDWFMKKLKGGMRCLKENGWLYTLRLITGKICKRLKFTAVWRIMSTYQQKVIKGYDLYSKAIEKYGENSILLLSSPSIGDSYIFGRMFFAFSNRMFEGKTPVFIVSGKSSFAIGSMFGINNIEKYPIENFLTFYNLLMFGNEKLHLFSMHYHVFYRHTAILGYIEGIHQLNFFEFIKSYLGIPSEIELQSPQINRESYFIKNNTTFIEGNAVILAPYARSIRPLPLNFWIKLANRLIALGMQVYTNSTGNHEPIIENTIALYATLDNLSHVVKSAGTIIGLRSGLLDIVSDENCLTISICPKNRYRRSPICTIDEFFSLSKMYGENPNHHDIIYTPENEDELIHDIENLIIEAKRLKGRAYCID